ncbi:hypothetical protein LOTGIDRAFT_236412 [Lottia gigantea]|uniref:DUF19 domain-containing protein n=1 Tax=Lottia gigantea TaxID=225164 RepID=V3YZT5_LOTGI|nr:hypothetical protein LOTGIDRAFT_236412 [Lottia gigantea]ESO83728.1 hypothetical protein LOTGIDRAFT_236412 [Lottia gigantea]
MLYFIGTGSSLTTSSPSTGGVSITECANMNKKCMGKLINLQRTQNPQDMCRILNSTLDCFNVVVAKCGGTLPNTEEIERMMVRARKQVALACNAGENVPTDTTEGCQEKVGKCMNMMQDFSVGPNKEDSCREFQNIKSCFESVTDSCDSDQIQVGRYMTGLEKQIAQICGGIDFETETAVKTKPVQGGTDQLKCFEELQRCSTESNILSESDCEGIMSTIECLGNVTSACPGVFNVSTFYRIEQIENMAANCSSTTDETEKEEEVDSAWCASKAQSCLNMISSFSVKNGMEATCGSLHNMVKCFDEVIDKCESSIVDLEKNSGQLFAMKEKITSACRKGGTGLVITPNSNQEKCMNKYKRCAGMMAKVPLHEDNKVMCPLLRRSMACIKKVSLECGSLLPASAKQQFSNFENLNKICPVGSYKSGGSRGKFTEKCSNDIKVCDGKANSIMSGDNIAKTDCRDGFRTLTCYRQVARECRLPKSNRKFFKHFKTTLTDTCERRSTVKHTRGLIDFDIDWPWEDQDWNGEFEGDDSSEDAVLFGDEDFEMEKDFMFD